MNLNPQKGLFFALSIASVGTIFLFIAGFLWRDPLHPLMLAGYVLLFCAVLLKWYSWRCPACRRSFPVKVRNLPDTCPFCRHKLN